MKKIIALILLEVFLFSDFALPLAQINYAHALVPALETNLLSQLSNTNNTRELAEGLVLLLMQKFYNDEDESQEAKTITKNKVKTEFDILMSGRGIILEWDAHYPDKFIFQLTVPSAKPQIYEIAYDREEGEYHLISMASEPTTVAISPILEKYSSLTDHSGLQQEIRIAELRQLSEMLDNVKDNSERLGIPADKVEVFEHNRRQIKEDFPWVIPIMGANFSYNDSVFEIRQGEERIFVIAVRGKNEQGQYQLWLYGVSIDGEKAGSVYRIGEEKDFGKFKGAEGQVLKSVNITLFPQDISVAGAELEPVGLLTFKSDIEATVRLVPLHKLQEALSIKPELWLSEGLPFYYREFSKDQLDLLAAESKPIVASVSTPSVSPVLSDTEKRFIKAMVLLLNALKTANGDVNRINKALTNSAVRALSGKADIVPISQEDANIFLEAWREYKGAGGNVNKIRQTRFNKVLELLGNIAIEIAKSFVDNPTVITALENIAKPREGSAAFHLTKHTEPLADEHPLKGHEGPREVVDETGASLNEATDIIEYCDRYHDVITVHGYDVRVAKNIIKTGSIKEDIQKMLEQEYTKEEMKKISTNERGELDPLRIVAADKLPGAALGGDCVGNKLVLLSKGLSKIQDKRARKVMTKATLRHEIRRHELTRDGDKAHTPENNADDVEYIVRVAREEGFTNLQDFINAIEPTLKGTKLYRMLQDRLQVEVAQATPAEAATTRTPESQAMYDMVNGNDLLKNSLTNVRTALERERITIKCSVDTLRSIGDLMNFVERLPKGVKVRIIAYTTLELQKEAFDGYQEYLRGKFKQQLGLTENVEIDFVMGAPAINNTENIKQIASGEREGEIQFIITDGTENPHILGKLLDEVQGLKTDVNTFVLIRQQNAEPFFISWVFKDGKPKQISVFTSEDAAAIKSNQFDMNIFEAYRQQI